MQAPHAIVAKAKKPIDFKDHHAAKFGLKVVAKSLAIPSIVTSVLCLFCASFGKEDIDGKKRKKCGTKYYEIPFRTDNYTQHLCSEHPEKWKLYQALETTSAKEAFLAQDNNGIDEYYDAEQNELHMKLDKGVVDTIVGELLVPEDDEDEVSLRFRERSMAYLTELHPDEAEQDHFYMKRVKKVTLYKLTVSFLSNSLSFRAVKECIENVIEDLQAGVLAGLVSRDYVSLTARLTVAYNLTQIKDLLAKTWAFSIALDMANHASVGLLDLRFRLVVNGVLLDLHILCIPVVGSHSGENMSLHTTTVLNVLEPAWRNKLIGICSDGTASNTGLRSGVVTRLQKECIRSGLFRVWCISHQVDLIVQAAWTSMYDGEWKSLLTSYVGHLRQQQKLILDMGTTCPYLTSRWLALESVTGWMVANYEGLEEHYNSYGDEERLATDPRDVKGAAWWVTLYAVHSICCEMRPLMVGCQGKTMLLCTAHEIVELTMKDVAALCMGEGPGLSDERRVEIEEDVEAHIVVGEFSFRAFEMSEWISGLGITATEFLQRVYTTDEELYRDMLLDIGTAMGHICNGLLKLASMRKVDNSAELDSKPEACLPQDLVKLHLRDFNHGLIRQRERIAAVSMPGFTLHAIEKDFKAFVHYVSDHPEVRAELDALHFLADFKTSWEVGGVKRGIPLSRQFKILCQYAGGLASPFPTNATVEADFSQVRREKNNSRMSLQNFSLEGVLHAKVRKELDRYLK